MSPVRKTTCTLWSRLQEMRCEMNYRKYEVCSLCPAALTHSMAPSHLALHLQHWHSPPTTEFPGVGLRSLAPGILLVVSRMLQQPHHVALDWFAPSPWQYIQYQVAFLQAAVGKVRQLCFPSSEKHTQFLPVFKHSAVNPMRHSYPSWRMHEDKQTLSS